MQRLLNQVVPMCPFTKFRFAIVQCSSTIWSVSCRWMAFIDMCLPNCSSLVFDRAKTLVLLRSLLGWLPHGPCNVVKFVDVLVCLNWQQEKRALLCTYAFDILIWPASRASQTNYVDKWEKMSFRINPTNLMGEKITQPPALQHIAD